MNILVIGRSFPEIETGMIGVFEIDQAIALQNAGNSVEYYFCDTRSIFRIQKLDRVEFEYQGVKVVGDHLPIGRLPYTLFSMIKEKVFLSHLREVLESFKPDVIHIHYPTMLTNKIWAYIRSLNTVVVVTEHLTTVMTNQISSRTRELETRIANEADGFICVSEKLKESVQEISNVKDKIVVIPNMVGTEFGIRSFKKRDTFIFSYIGAIRKVKQVDKLIKAFCAFLQTSNKICKLRIIGDGPCLKKVKKITNRLQIAGYIDFYGNVAQSKVAELLESTDFFITASRLETFCVPVAEAWCSGVPVIMPDSIPLVTYANEENSIIFEDSNISEMAKAMQTAITEFRIYNSEMIAKNAQNIFSNEVVVSRITDLYFDLLGRNRK